MKNWTCAFGLLCLIAVASHAQNRGEMLLMNTSPSVKTPTDGCPLLPAGSIVIGDYCRRVAVPSPLVAPVYALEVKDGTLKSALERWATLSGRQLVWMLDADLPIDRKREYGSDLLVAMNVLMREASGSVPMAYGVDQRTITVMNATALVTDTKAMSPK